MLLTAIVLFVIVYALGAILMDQYMELYKAHENEAQFFETALADTVILLFWPAFVAFTLLIKLLTHKSGE